MLPDLALTIIDHKREMILRLQVNPAGSECPFSGCITSLKHPSHPATVVIQADSVQSVCESADALFASMEQGMRSSTEYTELLSRVKSGAGAAGGMSL